MVVMKSGSAGEKVAAVQNSLKALGFDPGKADGKFGPRTKAAVIEFQKSRKLVADGIVGPKTLAALGWQTETKNPVAELVPSSTPPTRKSGASLQKGKTPLLPSPELVTKMFPGTPSKNIDENLPYVLSAMEEANLADREMLLMALATIRVETGNFTPLSEYKSKYNTSPGGKPFDLYDNRRDLGNQGPPDGSDFRGRGYIQLTGRSNYKEHGAKIGLGNQLVQDPKLANEPLIAARLLASFLKGKEYEIREALAVGNLKLARRLVNGGSHGLKEFVATYRLGEKLF